MRGFACYCNEVGGLRCDRLNPKGVSPLLKHKGMFAKSQHFFRIQTVNRRGPANAANPKPPSF